MSFSRILTAGALVSALALGAGGALAQTAPAPTAPPPAAADKSPGPHGHRAQSFIELFDTNKDGKASTDEIIAEHARLFGASDIDKDGSLSVDEFRRRGRLLQSLGTTTLFDMLDANGDGKISQAELDAPTKRWVARYDANKDGAMNADELPGRDRGPGGPRHDRR